MYRIIELLRIPFKSRQTINYRLERPSNFEKSFETHGVRPELLDTLLVVLSILMYKFQIKMSNSILFCLLIAFGLIICTFRLRTNKKTANFQKRMERSSLNCYIYMNVREMETAKKGSKIYDAQSKCQTYQIEKIYHCCSSFGDIIIVVRQRFVWLNPKWFSFFFSSNADI